MRSTLTLSTLHPIWAWALGLAAGLIGTWIAALVPVVGVPILALVALALVLREPRAAIGGGMLLATGLWFAYFQYNQIANCDAINATGGVCQMGDTSANTTIVFMFIAAGAAFSIYALFLGKRSLRGGE